MDSFVEWCWGNCLIRIFLCAVLYCFINQSWGPLAKQWGVLESCDLILGESLCFKNNYSGWGINDKLFWCQENFSVKQGDWRLWQEIEELRNVLATVKIPLPGVTQTQNTWSTSMGGSHNYLVHVHEEKRHRSSEEGWDTCWKINQKSMLSGLELIFGPFDGSIFNCVCCLCFSISHRSWYHILIQRNLHEGSIKNNLQPLECMLAPVHLRYNRCLDTSDEISDQSRENACQGRHQHSALCQNFRTQRSAVQRRCLKD